MLSANLHVRASLLKYEGRREMVPAGLRWLPDGRGGVRYRLDGGFPRRGCRRKSGCKNAFDQLLFPRVPLRYALPRAVVAARCRGPINYQASGSEKRSSSMRRPPRRRRHHPPRDGSTDLAEESSVPEGQPKSALVPIRRPPSRGGPLHRSASKRFFLLDRAQPVLFLSRTKREWGVHCPAINIADPPVQWDAPNPPLSRRRMWRL